MSEGAFSSNDDAAAQFRVVVMDDQPIVRAGFLHLLGNSEFVITAAAETVAILLTHVETHLPAVILGEIQLNGEPVIESIPRLRRALPNLGVLFYSASDNPLDEARAFSGGANGYLYRATRREPLLVALRRVARGEMLWTGADQRRLSSYLRDGRPQAGSFAPLTSREQEILRMVTTGATNREISAALGISHETVKEHVQHLLKKLGVSDRTQAAVWAIRNGIA